MYPKIKKYTTLKYLTNNMFIIYFIKKTNSCLIKNKNGNLEKN